MVSFDAALIKECNRFFTNVSDGCQCRGVNIGNLILNGSVPFLITTSDGVAAKEIPLPVAVAPLANKSLARTIRVVCPLR